MSRDGNKGKDEVGEHERREEVKGGQYLLGLEQGSRGQGERDGQGKDQDKKVKKKRKKTIKKRVPPKKKPRDRAAGRQETPECSKRIFDMMVF